VSNHCIKLGEISESTRGVLAKSTDIFSAKKEGSKLYLIGNIYRYEINPFFYHVFYGAHLKEKPKEYHFFEGCRILVRRLISRKLRVMATLVCDEFINKKDIYNIIVSNAFKAEYVLAIINSKITSFLLTKGSVTSTKDDFSQITLSEIRDINIPLATEAEQAAIALKVSSMIENISELNTIKTRFSNLLQSELAIKLNKKLEAWQELDFSEFSEELKKLKVILTLSQKAEWMDYFNQQQQRALVLKSEIEQTDQAIDQMVYALYGLTDEEIKIVEEG
jgi:hypothetical protein